MRSQWVVLTAVLAGGGCDFVFGLGDPQPCEARSFDGAAPNPITAADNFTMSRDQSFVVLDVRGLLFQASPIDAEPVPLDLGAYTDTTFSLAPEGTSLFYTAAVEPPKLLGALRADATNWRLDATVPAGTYAGTPSADEYGPRRLLVKMRATDTTLQEYEDDGGVWTPLGAPHEASAGSFAPNLTPNGLTMVYAVDQTLPDLTIEAGVFVETRPSRDAWFGNRTQILAGVHRSPQLLDTCRALYTVDEPGDAAATSGELERYDQP